MVVTGYVIRGTTDILSVLGELRKVSQKLQRLCEKEYHRLLGEEIAFLCDCIATNVLNKKSDENIFDAAVDNLNKRMQAANYTSLPRFNLKAYAHIIPYEGDTYLRILCPNPYLLKAFQQLEEYSLSEMEYQDDGNKKKKTWMAIFALCKNQSPFTIELTKDVIICKKKITYPDVNERAAVLARHTLTSQYLNQIGGGEQIPPFRLMPYFDLAVEMLTTEESKIMIREKTTKLKQILIDLNKDDSVVFPKSQEESEEIQTDK